MLLNPSVVDVWAFDLLAPDERVENAYDLLSEDERQRAGRFHFPADRRRFIIARASLRQVLGDYLEIAPKRLAFEYSEYGKPRLSSPNTDLRFNASRSRERALIACTTGREIGVDIECIRLDLDIDDFAQRFFSIAENERLRAVPDDVRHLAFLRCWTCKEAYAKALGKGLSLDPRGLDVSVVLNNLNNLAARTGATETFVVDEWSLVVWGTDIVEGYLSALAVERGEFVVKIHPIRGHQFPPRI
jgi:4'-phosphopantetheinyl transferase